MTFDVVLRNPGATFNIRLTGDDYIRAATAGIVTVATTSRMAAFFRSVLAAMSVTPVPPGAILIVHLDENTGTIAYDSSPNHNNGTLYGSAPWCVGKSGAAINFDGASEIILTSDPLSGLANVTIAAWIKRGNLNFGTTSNKSIFGNMTATVNKSYLFVSKTTNKVGFQLMANLTTTTVINSALTEGVWYHVVATYDGATVRLYVDNVLQADSDVNTGALAAGGHAVVGRALSDRYWKGVADELYVYDRVLSDAERTQLYQYQYRAQRILTAIRLSVGAIGMAGVSSRWWIGTRVASSAVNLTSTSGRVKSAIRSASTTLNQVAVAARSLIVARVVIGTIGVVGASKRVKGAIRSVTGVISQIGIASRGLVLTRMAAGSISQLGTASRSLVITRAAAAVEHFVAVTKRAGSIFVRAKSAAIGVVGISGRASAKVRSAVGVISQLGVARRELVLMRKAVGSISQLGVALRAGSIFIRAKTGAIVLTGVPVRTLVYVRSAVGVLHQTAVSIRSLVLTRGVSVIVSLIAIADRETLSVRSAIGTLRQTGVASRALVMARLAIAGITQTAVASRFVAKIRSVTAALTQLAISDRFVAMFRSASAALSEVAASSRKTSFIMKGSVTLILSIKRVTVATLRGVYLKFANKEVVAE